MYTFDDFDIQLLIQGKITILPHENNQQPHMKIH